MIPGFFAAGANGGGGGGGDPYWANVVALLHFDGSDGSTAMVDATGRSWSASGDAQLDTSWSQFGPSSLLLDGSGDYIYTPDSAAVELGSQNFTIEFWIRTATIVGNSNVAAKVTLGNGSWTIYRAGGNLFFYASSNGSTWDIANGILIGSVSPSNAYHIAVARHGSDILTFLDGVPGGTATSSAAIINNTAPLVIGGDSSGEERFAGHIDEFRLTIGVARYTSSFTPPAAPFPDS